MGRFLIRTAYAAVDRYSMFLVLQELFFVIYNMLFCNFLGSSMWIALGITQLNILSI